MIMASNTPLAGQAGSHHQSGLISLNVGGGTLVISEILRRFKPLVLCLQEVNIMTKELNSIVRRLNYQGESNIDPEFPNQRGTAIICPACLWSPHGDSAPACPVPGTGGRGHSQGGAAHCGELLRSHWVCREGGEGEHYLWSIAPGSQGNGIKAYCGGRLELSDICE